MDDMTDRVIVQGESNIEVIKHRIYEVQGQHLTSHIVTSNVDNLTKGGEFDHLFGANPSKSMVLNKTAIITGI